MEIEVKLDIKTSRWTHQHSTRDKSPPLVLVTAVGNVNVYLVLSHIPDEQSNLPFLASDLRSDLVSSHLIIFYRLGLLSEQRRFSARHFCIFYLYLFSYQYL